MYNSNPSVCRPLVARPGGSMRQYGEQLVAGAGPKQPGRKCLSRTQMSEPYELSQDLLDKQLEMLGSRYGGLGAANTAANTIQRAYRRYSMMKKFAAITSAAQGKMENRLSRRFQGGAGLAVSQHTVRHVAQDAVDSAHSGHRHNCCVYTQPPGESGSTGTSGHLTLALWPVSSVP